MNPQIQAILQAILGVGSTVQQPFAEGGDFQQFSMGGGFNNDNNALMRAVGGFTPVNINPNYGGTVNRFFSQNPLAGPKAFTGASPLQSGSAGNNAVRGGSGHSSFMPNDFNSTMQQWM